MYNYKKTGEILSKIEYFFLLAWKGYLLSPFYSLPNPKKQNHLLARSVKSWVAEPKKGYFCCCRNFCNGSGAYF